MLGGWHRPDVAQAQRDLVLRELQDPHSIGPFTAFLWAIRKIKLEPPVTLLDVGCGVGHYGVLCEKYFPRIAYTGTDASAAIIAEAKLLAPLGRFEVCDFTANLFEDYDIVMASQVVETMPDPLAAMKHLLRWVTGYVILNRIRLTEPRDAPSHQIDEATYCGEIGTNWLWNLSELTTLIEAAGLEIIGTHTWDNQTCILAKRGGEWRVSSMR